VKKDAKYSFQYKGYFIKNGCIFWDNPVHQKAMAKFIRLRSFVHFVPRHPLLWFTKQTYYRFFIIMVALSTLTALV